MYCISELNMAAKSTGAKASLTEVKSKVKQNPVKLDEALRRLREAKKQSGSYDGIFAVDFKSIMDNETKTVKYSKLAYINETGKMIPLCIVALDECSANDALQKKAQGQKFDPKPMLTIKKYKYGVKYDKDTKQVISYPEGDDKKSKLYEFCEYLNQFMTDKVAAAIKDNTIVSEENYDPEKTTKTKKPTIVKSTKFIPICSTKYSVSGTRAGEKLGNPLTKIKIRWVGNQVAIDPEFPITAKLYDIEKIGPDGNPLRIVGKDGKSVTVGEVNKYINKLTNGNLMIKFPSVAFSSQGISIGTELLSAYISQRAQQDEFDESSMLEGLSLSAKPATAPTSGSTAASTSEEAADDLAGDDM